MQAGLSRLLRPSAASEHWNVPNGGRLMVPARKAGEDERETRVEDDAAGVWRLMPFAQIATRIGWTVTVTLAIILLACLG